MAAGTMDELAAQLLLELAQALAVTRLGEAEPLGAATKVELLREGEGDPELAQLDRGGVRVDARNGRAPLVSTGVPLTAALPGAS